MATLEDLKQKRDQLTARIEQVEARQRAEQKKAEDRVKILIGAALLDQVRQGRESLNDLLAMMDGFLSRQHERKAVLGEDGKGAEVLLRLSGHAQ